jgi:hypothetical protein
MKIERDFIEELEEKAREQQLIVKTEMIPVWAKGIGDWLVVNPWRVLVPIAAMVYLILRIVFGNDYLEFILGLFGGFAR